MEGEEERGKGKAEGEVQMIKVLGFALIGRRYWLAGWLD